MKIVRSKTFRAERAWGALDIANVAHPIGEARILVVEKEGSV
ncbi:hypothetical protein [Hydrogenophaga crocea]|nr:hypothetical protein [Hydrogenophaga crocea]